MTAPVAFIIIFVLVTLWILVPEWCIAHSENLWVRRISWYVLYINDGLAEAFINEGPFYYDHEYQERQHADFVKRYGERP